MNQYVDSSFFANPNYTDSQFVEEIKNKTSMILKNVFPNIPQKQRISNSTSGLTIACPYCGDSARDMSKKRGHILLNGKFTGHYKCFNCNAFRSLPNFFKDFKQDLSLSGLQYVQEHKQDISTFGGISSEITADIFSKSIALQYGIDKNYFRDMLRLYDINHPAAKVAKDYLINRAQYRFDKFLYDSKTNYLLILNLCENKIIGFQMRSLNPNTPKDKRFLTFNIDRIYKKILKNYTIEIPADLNTLSLLFDIYNINVYQPIIVVEGPMDAFLLPNAIATTGATKSLNVELPFYYMFDADATGTKYAVKKLNEKQKVFLWGKFKTDYNLPNKAKWDVNDVVLYLRQFNINKINWLNYFSDNPFDMLYIDSLTGNF